MRIGTVLIVVGAALVVVGATVRFAPGLFSWFGHLPGDVRSESDGSRVFIPITSMILVSGSLTLIANLIAFLLRNR